MSNSGPTLSNVSVPLDAGPFAGLISKTVESSRGSSRLRLIAGQLLMRRPGNDCAQPLPELCSYDRARISSGSEANVILENHGSVDLCFRIPPQRSRHWPGTRTARNEDTAG